MTKIIITADTPLSALIRKDFHGELTMVINGWRQHLVGVDPAVDALQLSQFYFDLSRFPPGEMYRLLARLLNYDAVIPCMSVLSRYIAEHSNLRASSTSVYRQINRYREMGK